MLPERRRLSLGSGGSLSLIEWGSATGSPVLYLHGTPSSAVEGYWLHHAAERHGLRLIAVDRPGYGASPSAAGGFATTGTICAEVADQLGLERFGVCAFSGGAGHALGVAAVSGDRVTRVQIGGGMGSIVGTPTTVFPRARRIQLTAMCRIEPVFRMFARRMSTRRQAALESKLRIPIYAGLEMLGDAAGGEQLAAVEAFVRDTPTADLREFVAAYADAWGHLDAIVDDFRAIGSPWPFDLGTLRVPVELWHGSADGAVPSSMARWISSRLPDATVHELQDEGHFVFLSHPDEVCKRFL